MINIHQYFTENIFDESTVLEFEYKADKQLVTLVCDYAYDALQAVLQGKKPPLKLNDTAYHGDFRKLTFYNVTAYQREVSRKDLEKYKNRYFAKDKAGVVIQYLEVISKDLPGVFNIDIRCGDFGTCVFSFTDLEVERKLVWSPGKREDTGDWEYIDIETGQPVDFYKPFG